MSKVKIVFKSEVEFDIDELGEGRLKNILANKPIDDQWVQNKIVENAKWCKASHLE